MKIYLAGPIEICSEEEIFLWRNYISSKVGKDITIITPKYHLGSDEEIFENTRSNVEECDIVFAHLPKAINETLSPKATLGNIKANRQINNKYAKVINKNIIIFTKRGINERAPKKP